MKEQTDSKLSEEFLCLVQLVKRENFLIKGTTDFEPLSTAILTHTVLSSRTLKREVIESISDLLLKGEGFGENTRNKELTPLKKNVGFWG